MKIQWQYFIECKLQFGDWAYVFRFYNLSRLHSTNMRYCFRSLGITDTGVMAIARGFPLLQTINLAYCTGITDDSLRSLSKCSNLYTLEIRGCPQVSSLGLAAIAVGCQKLTNLDIKKCYHVNDAGILFLACFSQNLRQVLASFVLYLWLLRVRLWPDHMWYSHVAFQINLSYCSVTDVGLLALASVSCLQNMTILHLGRLTPSGLAAALLACGGLTKVKLHSSFKPLVPKPLLKHIEARGCVFQWRDKPFQVFSLLWFKDTVVCNVLFVLKIL